MSWGVSSTIVVPLLPTSDKLYENHVRASVVVYSSEFLVTTANKLRDSRFGALPELRLVSTVSEFICTSNSVLQAWFAFFGNPPHFNMGLHKRAL